MTLSLSRVGPEHFLNTPDQGREVSRSAWAWHTVLMAPHTCMGQTLAVSCPERFRGKQGFWEQAKILVFTVITVILGGTWRYWNF